VEVDRNICCFATGKLYTEAILGVGVSRDGRNLSTAGELLSKEAFDGGLRMNTNKSPFEFFLPMWINKAHSAQSQAWCQALQESCLQIGREVSKVGDLDKAAWEILPRLINQLIVEMMKPDAPKSEAIATFETMCNLWRTLRWLVDTRAQLRDWMAAALSGFVSKEALRHKDQSPDLGVILVVFTVAQGHASCPTRQAFIGAYADENQLRWVRWWQQSGTLPEAGPVFQATKVSREICMFQMMVVDVVIGNVSETLTAMEATNCKLPERLESLQSQWRVRKSTTSDWAAYFLHLGTPKPAFNSSAEWIADCVRRAALKGPKYATGKGGGKGSGGHAGKRR